MKKNVLIVFLLMYISAQAQKLPNKQEKSIYAPTDIKVDGKAIEWNNQLSAYNHATEIFYTIANDDKNLYLVVQATKTIIIQKIISQAITFSIKTSIKNGLSTTSFTYPLLHNNTGTILMNLNRSPVNGNNDSLVNEMNKQLMDKSKEIKITGVKNFADSTLSIYNDNDIQVSSRFDGNKVYTYELSIPLKILGLATNKVDKLGYSITLNGLSAYGTKVALSPDGSAIRIGDSSNGRTAIELPTNPNMMILDFPTDFSGEYTLSKKP